MSVPNDISFLRGSRAYYHYNSRMTQSDDDIMMIDSRLRATLYPSVYCIVRLTTSQLPNNQNNLRSKVPILCGYWLAYILERIYILFNS